MGVELCRGITTSQSLPPWLAPETIQPDIRTIHTISVSGRTASGGVIGTNRLKYLVIPLDPRRKTLRVGRKSAERSDNLGPSAGRDNSIIRIVGQVIARHP